MTRSYLIFVNGVLAKRKLTLAGAMKALRELEAKGYQKVSVAEEIKSDVK